MTTMWIWLVLGCGSDEHAHEHGPNTHEHDEAPAPTPPPTPAQAPAPSAPVAAHGGYAAALGDGTAEVVVADGKLMLYVLDAAGAPVAPEGNARVVFTPPRGRRAAAGVASGRRGLVC